jgi:hypothetical protein
MPIRSRKCLWNVGNQTLLCQWDGFATIDTLKTMEGYRLVFRETVNILTVLEEGKDKGKQVTAALESITFETN